MVDSEDDAVDDVLLRLVWLTDSQNERESTFPLTVIAHGALITGSLMPHWQWLETAAHSSSGGRPDADDWFLLRSDSLRKKAAEFRQALDDEERDLTAEELDLVSRNPTHIHFRDARFEGANAVQMPPMPWRVRLSEVDAWHFGSIERK